MASQGKIMIKLCYHDCEFQFRVFTIKKTHHIAPAVIAFHVGDI